MDSIATTRHIKEIGIDASIASELGEQMHAEPTLSVDEPEVISLIGEPIAITGLPGDRYRWRLPLSAHPSSH
jgi:hypothetical protein